jgi:hypothetical protein
MILLTKDADLLLNISDPDVRTLSVIAKTMKSSNSYTLRRLKRLNYYGYVLICPTSVNTPDYGREYILSNIGVQTVNLIKKIKEPKP